MKIIIKIFRKKAQTIIIVMEWFIRFLSNEKTKRVYNKGKVVVCGNGPSTKSFPFSVFTKKGYDYCCVNWFPLDKDLFFDIKPKYYVCVDPIIHERKEDLSERELQLVSILNSVNWNMMYVCKKSKHFPINNKHIVYSYINQNVISAEYSKGIKWMLDYNIATFGYQNVIVAALYYFIMSGVDEVILTGVENDWHRELIVDKNNEVFRQLNHFYGKELINVTEHGEIKKGELYNYFKFYYLTLYQYYLLSKYSNSSKTKIFNTVTNSYIDVFPKIEI